MNKKYLVILLIILILIIVGAYFLVQPKKQNAQPASETAALSQVQSTTDNQGSVATDQNQKTPTSYNIQGMKVEILKEGSGDAAKSGDAVTVNYVGTLENGTKFDSSIDRGTPFQFTLGQNRVIQGWELGVVGMKVGEKRKLTIPPELGYGDQAVGGVIPANATLVFEIDLLGINK